ncbi:PREDICTED: ras GTPase-activating protein 3-like, partial [Priapulus caudatus]|uniref:Ras GTPase-activating protein 3-like n=1 Tax=Priapulus caudatus TaxID=37621 RepID=A0ABM1ECR6_PRICU
MAARVDDVRVQESLKIKIAEAKDLQFRGGSANGRETYCTVGLDQEEIFRTAPAERSINPLYSEEFQCEIPRHFRFLSLYVHDRESRPEKVINKVSIKKEDLK